MQLGGQGWPLSLGRRDSTTANMVQANNDLPSPNSDLDTLIAAFGKKNFTDRELVALSGAHTIGLAQCANVDKSQQQRCINANTNVLPARREDAGGLRQPLLREPAQQRIAALRPRARGPRRSQGPRGAVRIQ